MPVGGRTVEVPALPWSASWDAQQFPPAPDVDKHGATIRAEFEAELVSS